MATTDKHSIPSSPFVGEIDHNEIKRVEVIQIFQLIKNEFREI